MPFYANNTTRAIQRPPDDSSISLGWSRHTDGRHPSSENHFLFRARTRYPLPWRSAEEVQRYMLKTNMRACDLPPNELENLTADRSSWRSSFKKQVSDFERRRILSIQDKRVSARPVVSYRQIADSPVTSAVVSVHQGSVSSLTNELICDPEIRRVDGSVHHYCQWNYRSVLIFINATVSVIRKIIRSVLSVCH